MKIRITDKFLWDIYHFLDKTANVAGFIFRRRRTIYDILPGPKNPVIEQYMKKMTAQEFSKLIYYLKSKNYIKAKNLEGKEAIMLTKKGISKAIKASFELEGKKKRKDGKWIMLIFDVPKKHAKARRLLRSVLCNLGYKMFQHSVWITPYDVSEKTEKLMQSYCLDQYIRIFLIEAL